MGRIEGNIKYYNSYFRLNSEEYEFRTENDVSEDPNSIIRHDTNSPKLLTFLLFNIFGSFYFLFLWYMVVHQIEYTNIPVKSLESIKISFYM